MGDVTVQYGPEPLDGVEMGARGRQWDQMNATVFAQQERSDIGAFVVWGIVPNDVNDTFISSTACQIWNPLDKCDQNQK